MADENEKASRTLTTLNRWLIGLVGFSMIYTMVVFTVMEQKQAKLIQGLTPIALVDPATLKVSPLVSNLIPSNILTNKSVDFITSTNSPLKPMFERKKEYQYGEYVIVSFFYVHGVIVGKFENEEYEVLYKNHERTLVKIRIRGDMLMAPTSINSVNPISLLSN